MEVLTAYVREGVPKQEGDTPEEAKSPPTDIQAILTVIGRRETTGNARRKDRLDLTHTQLVGAALHNADLSKANLRGANLSQADLSNTDLSLADLKNAALLGADLFGAALHSTDLGGANMLNAKNLTEDEVRNTKNWREATLPVCLEHMKDRSD